MSLKSWTDEFYTISANEVLKKDAVAHSLKKWIGLRPEHLERHGLELNLEKRCIKSSDEEFDIDADTCALCVHYFNILSHCFACPLSNNGYTCYNLNKPYYIWISTGNPEPMIKALEACEE